MWQPILTGLNACKNLIFQFIKGIYVNIRLYLLHHFK